ncbi:MAG: sugar transferase [Tannerellaceae bacterium]|nr:sugar transferase [Tannerellaceae bacterium]
MNKVRQTAKYVISDILAASLAWLLFNVVRYNEVAIYKGFDGLLSFLSHRPVWEGQLLIPIFWLVLYFFSGYYNKPFAKSRLNELLSTFITSLTGTLIIFFVLVLKTLLPSISVYYQLFFTLFGLQFVFTYIPRIAITQRTLKKLLNRELLTYVLVIGTGKKAIHVASSLSNSGYTITGLIKEECEEIPENISYPVLGSLEDLPDIVNRFRVDELVVALETSDNYKLVNILYTLYHHKCPIKISADRMDTLAKIKIKTLTGTPLVDLTGNNFSDAESNIKLFMDKVLSVFVLIFLSPLFAYIAWRVKQDSKGPVFFRQERIGYLGKPFTIYKFRTMYEDAEKGVPLLVNEDDSRITPFGRTMRKYRLDELPQFWNVLKGDMSIVGPRPERKFFIDQIVKKAPYYYLLHNVRPGITSLGMVKYGYADQVDKMIERLDYDILYYENMSLRLDITILFYTIKTVLTGKGI